MLSRGISFLMDFLHVRHYKNRSTGKNKKRPKTDGLYGWLNIIIEKDEQYIFFI